MQQNIQQPHQNLQESLRGPMFSPFTAGFVSHYFFPLISFLLLLLLQHHFVLADIVLPSLFASYGAIESSSVQQTFPEGL